jgi:hypothetical protein
MYTTKMEKDLKVGWQKEMSASDFLGCRGRLASH